MVVDVTPLFSTLSGMLVVAGDSLLNPTAAGVISCVTAPVDIISVITPLPGVGFVDMVRLASAVRAATLL
jgi:hypothetical protein